ncbi:hypothetical protein LTR37_016153, partial [Vermiconidia calcicola]
MASQTQVITNGQQMFHDTQSSHSPPPSTSVPVRKKAHDSPILPSKQGSGDVTPRSRSQSHSSTAETKNDGPEGGLDKTPMPYPPSGTVGYTLKITIHRATHLAMGDAHAFSSDPYVLAQLNTHLPQRHSEDPKLRFRTKTVRKTTDVEWNEEWIVANVPSTGFRLKLRVYDEDPADHDDILGKVHIDVPSFDENWSGINDQGYHLQLRDSSKRALAVRAVATAMRSTKHMRGELYVSIEMVGRTGEDGQHGRAYTLSPCRWIRHYSPILGRIANIKEPEKEKQAKDAETNCPVQKNINQYDFQANQMQLPGPVPLQLYHRFVQFKPWVKRMFTTSGVQGMVLGKALHHQHTRVYNFGRSTIWGSFPDGASGDLTRKFLELVHHDTGGRIFTYVMTLDAVFRFTETGQEFGIDMLSKHTMHSDVSVYIAFSGEFFIRRRKRKDQPPPSNTIEESSQRDEKDHSEKRAHAEEDGSPDDDAPKDPSNYELFIDNDSGTYRPSATMLPVLAEYLSACLPGLKVQTLDCQADQEKMAKLKDEQRERKKQEGQHIVYAQVSDSSSISSSDDERLDEVYDAFHSEQPQRNRHHNGRTSHSETLSALTKDLKLQQD